MPKLNSLTDNSHLFIRMSGRDKQQVLDDLANTLAGMHIEGYKE